MEKGVTPLLQSPILGAHAHAHGFGVDMGEKLFSWVGMGSTIMGARPHPWVWALMCASGRGFRGGRPRLILNW